MSTFIFVINDVYYTFSISKILQVNVILKQIHIPILYYYSMYVYIVGSLYYIRIQHQLNYLYLRSSEDINNISRSICFRVYNTILYSTVVKFQVK